MTTEIEAEAQPFQALVFDLGGVLVAHDNAVLYQRLASRCANACTPQTVVGLMRKTDWGSGVAISTLHDQLRGELGYGLGWDEFVADWCCHFAVDDSMLGFVERLATHNRVMLFSNTNQEHWDFLVAATDDLQDNVDGARRAGFQAELFETEAKLAGFLKGRGVRLG